MNSLASRRPAWLNSSVVRSSLSDRNVKVIQGVDPRVGPLLDTPGDLVRAVGHDPHDRRRLMGVPEERGEAAADLPAAVDRAATPPAADAVGRIALAAEAIRLGRALAALIPGESEVLALLALMLLHDARRDAPVRAGQVVPLDEQDRALWNDDQLREGTRDVAGGAGAATSWPVRAAGGDRRPAPARTAGLGTDRRAVRRPRPAHRLRRRRAEPRRRGRRTRRSRSWTRGARRARPRPTTATSTRPAPTCCGGPDARTRPGSPTNARSTSRRPIGSDGSCTVDSPRWDGVDFGYDDR